MPIKVTCACGKTLLAGDEQFGQKVRCEGCGSLLAVVPGMRAANSGSGTSEPRSSVATPTRPAMTAPQVSAPATPVQTAVQIPVQTRPAVAAAPAAPTKPPAQARPPVQATPPMQATPAVLAQAVAPQFPPITPQFPPITPQFAPIAPQFPPIGPQFPPITAAPGQQNGMQPFQSQAVPALPVNGFAPPSTFAPPAAQGHAAPGFSTFQPAPAPAHDGYGVSAEPPPTRPVFTPAVASSMSDRARKQVDADGSSGGGFGSTNSGVVGGMSMMLVAVVWFVLGLMADRIFFYPPVLLVLGFIAVIKGLASGR